MRAAETALFQYTRPVKALCSRAPLTASISAGAAREAAFSPCPACPVLTGWAVENLDKNQGKIL